MAKLRMEHEGVLYRNPSPGYRAECAFQPNTVALGNQELVCFCRMGQAFYSADGRIGIVRSVDGGVSWRKEPLVWDGNEDPRPYSYAAPHGTLLRDGSLLMVASRTDRSDPDQPMYNPVTGGMVGSEKVLFRSRDGGRTWSRPEILDLPQDGGVVDAPSQIIELNDGRLFLACEVWKSWDDARPLHIRGFCVFSDDGGSTWGDRVDPPSAGDSERMYSHSRYAARLDGRIMALQWTQSIGQAADYDLHFTVSDQTARKWSMPRSTGIVGQTSWTADLGGGRIAAVYTRREGMNPGIMVTLSEDDGISWDHHGEIQVWDAVGQEFLGVTRKPQYPQSHDNIAFGKPNLVRLPDGSLIAGWWCTQACVTHCRYAKLTAA